MKIRNNYFFLTGIAILLMLTLSYFIKINTDAGLNFVTKTPLLAILIFKNPIILGIYIIVALALITLGFKRIKII